MPAAKSSASLATSAAHWTGGRVELSNVGVDHLAGKELLALGEGVEHLECGLRLVGRDHMSSIENGEEGEAVVGTDGAAAVLQSYLRGR